MPIVPPPIEPEIVEADRASLRDMLEGSIELLEEMDRQINRPNLGWEPADQVALAYDRLSRAMRRSILFARRLDDGTDPERSRQDAAFFRAVLQVLRQTGSAIRRGISKQARTPAPFVPELTIADAGLALDRVFRSLRRTMLLNRVLAAHPVPKRHRARPAPQPAAAAHAPADMPADGASPDPAPLPDPDDLRLDAAHAQLARPGAEEAEFEAAERLDSLPPLPSAEQIARLHAALDARILPRPVSRERLAIRARQARRLQEWNDLHPEAPDPKDRAPTPSPVTPAPSAHAAERRPDPPDPNGGPGPQVLVGLGAKPQP